MGRQGWKGARLCPLLLGLLGLLGASPTTPRVPLLLHHPAASPPCGGLNRLTSEAAYSPLRQAGRTACMPVWVYTLCHWQCMHRPRSPPCMPVLAVPPRQMGCARCAASRSWKSKLGG